jgi:hypothetical protein
VRLAHTESRSGLSRDDAGCAGEHLGVPLREQRTEGQVPVGDRLAVVDRAEQAAEVLLRSGLGHGSDATLATVDDDLRDPALDRPVLALDHHAIDGALAVSSMLVRRRALPLPLRPRCPASGYEPCWYRRCRMRQPASVCTTSSS